MISGDTSFHVREGGREEGAIVLLWVEARECCEHPTTDRIALHKELSRPNVHGAEVEKPSPLEKWGQ